MSPPQRGNALSAGLGATTHSLASFVAQAITLPMPLKGIVFCLLVTSIIFYARTRKRLPPQPRRLPIIGSFFRLTDKEWLYSKDCKERFGEYYC